MTSDYEAAERAERLLQVRVRAAFISAYALNLYDALAARLYLPEAAETVDLATLRRWLGAPPGKLLRWQALKRALSAAVREIDACSQITVEAAPVRKGRAVASVRLAWSRKKPGSPAALAAAAEVNRHSAGRKARTGAQVKSAKRALSDELDRI